MSKKTKQKAPDHFKTDNVWLENAPNLVGIQPRGSRWATPDSEGVASIQLSLPGDLGRAYPLRPFDSWVADACYYFADQQEDPTAPVRVSLADMLDRLEVTRRQTGRRQGEGFHSDVYSDINATLLRLYQTEVDLRWNREGRSVHYKTRILSGFGWEYADGKAVEDVPDRLRARMNDGEPVVFKRTDARPVAILYTLARELTSGLLRRGPDHIGYTLRPSSMFELRSEAPLVKLLADFVWRQTEPHIRRKLSTLRKQLGIPGRNVTRDRNSLLKAGLRLVELGYFAAFSIDEFNMVDIQKPPRQSPD